MNILQTWNRVNRIPLLGRFLFSRFVGRVAPYSGSIYASVEELGIGIAKVSMRDRHCLRNPFQSIHAIALANLGELTTGLAFLTLIPKDKRGIVTSFNIDFLKKARGTILCECRTQFPEAVGHCEVSAELKNDQNEIVARVTATWNVSHI